MFWRDPLSQGKPAFDVIKQVLLIQVNLVVTPANGSERSINSLGIVSLLFSSIGDIMQLSDMRSPSVVYTVRVLMFSVYC